MSSQAYERSPPCAALRNSVRLPDYRTMPAWLKNDHERILTRERPRERPPEGRGRPAHRHLLAPAPAACPARTRRPGARACDADAPLHASHWVRGGTGGGLFSTVFVTALVCQALPGCAPRSLNSPSRAEHMLSYWPTRYSVECLPGLFVSERQRPADLVQYVFTSVSGHLMHDESALHPSPVCQVAYSSAAGCA